MTLASTTVVRSEAAATSATRWGYLAVCVICMVMIANLQYGWTFFVNPINKAQGWSIASIQFAFAVFIALETWLTPIEGWIVDVLGPHRGPKLVVAFGGVMVAVGWVINSYAATLEMLYLGAIISGIGGGAVYATCVGMAVKWFPDRGRLWRGHGAHRHSDPIRDRQLQLSDRLSLVRYCPGRRCVRLGVAVALSGGRRNGKRTGGEGGAVGAQL
jgi:hypothetical protein